MGPPCARAQSSRRHARHREGTPKGSGHPAQAVLDAPCRPLLIIVLRHVPPLAGNRTSCRSTAVIQQAGVPELASKAGFMVSTSAAEFHSLATDICCRRPPSIINAARISVSDYARGTYLIDAAVEARPAARRCEGRASADGSRAPPNCGSSMPGYTSISGPCRSPGGGAGSETLAGFRSGK